MTQSNAPSEGRESTPSLFSGAVPLDIASRLAESPDLQSNLRGAIPADVMMFRVNEWGRTIRQTCNWSRVHINNTEGILTATHCTGARSPRDTAYMPSIDPHTTRAMHVSMGTMPTLEAADVTDQELIGREVYVPWLLPNHTNQNEYIPIRATGRAEIDPGRPWFLRMRVDTGTIASAEFINDPSTGVGILNGISGAPVMLGDRVVGVVSMDSVDGEWISFSGPSVFAWLRGKGL